MGLSFLLIGLILLLNYFSLVVKPIYTGPENAREHMFYFPLLCAFFSGAALFVAWIKGSRVDRVVVFTTPFLGLVLLALLELSYPMFPVMYNVLSVTRLASLGVVALFLLFSPGIAQIIYLLKPNLKISIISPVALFVLFLIVRWVSENHISDTVEFLGQIPAGFYW